MTRRFIAVVAVISCAHFAAGQQLQKARVTLVVEDVKLLPKEATARPALLNDEVRQGTAIRTGNASRSELTFDDLTITRLGANTVFSFKPETRELKLSIGTALIQIPSAAPELKVSNQVVSAAITGGTAIFDAATGKFMVLEGTGRMWPIGHPEQGLTIYPGNIVWLTSRGQVSTPRTFDVKLVMKTSRLITGFARLANLPLIEQVIDDQQANEQPAIGPTPPIPVFEEIISQKVAATPLEVEPPPPIMPGEFGSPQTITSPAPYPIDSAAVINTAPTSTVTNNGVTDFGTIYRNQAEDGPLAAWAFGSASAFDIAISFSSTANSSFENVAAFKFQELELNGLPTILTKGGPTRLGLIGVDRISSGDVRGTFTFPGVDFVFLATQNGPISLGPEITLQGLDGLLLYARGLNGNLTLSSSFNDIGTLSLNAEGAIQINAAAPIDATTTLTVQAGRTLTWAGSIFLPDINTDTNASVNIGADDGIRIQGGVEISRSSGGTENGMNVSLSAGADLSVGGPVIITLTPHLIHTGGNMSLAAGGNITVSGPISLNSEVATDLFTGANITVAAANRNLSAQSIQGRIKVDRGAVVTSGANLSLSALGDIQGTSPTSSGGIVLGVETSGGGRIENGGGVSVTAGGNVMTPASLALSINNSNGGTSGSDAVVSLTANNVSAGTFSEVINNSNGGIIDGDASIVLNVLGDLTATGSRMDFRILNFGNTDGSGGNIAGSAAITVSAANITASSLLADMDGEHGLIGTSSTITFNISGTVRTTNAEFHIESAEPTGGAVGTLGPPDAITFNGGTYDIGRLFRAFISSRDGTIAFDTVNLHADTIKAGAFGSDGVLRIGGSSLNANALLKLYAPGSNGIIDFVANVTLSSHSAAAVIAANTITIENNVVVTITGNGGTALVYTNHPNYSGSGGNGTTSGTFAGNGATTSPLDSAPAFAANLKSSAAVTNGSTSVQKAGGVETRPLESRGTRFAAPKESAANPARPSRGVPRTGVRIADSTALLNLLTQTGSDGFSLVSHGRSSSPNAVRDRPENSPRRSRSNPFSRTSSASRDRTLIQGARVPKP